VSVVSQSLWAQTVMRQCLLLLFSRLGVMSCVLQDQVEAHNDGHKCRCSRYYKGKLVEVQRAHDLNLRGRQDCRKESTVSASCTKVQIRSAHTPQLLQRGVAC
jgi:hypothetical protein